jgi:hypothetical protein
MGGINSLPSLPALNLRPIEQQGDPVSKYLQLRSLMQGQQLQQGQMQLQQQQIQAATQENQMRQLQLQDSMKMRDLMPQFVTRDENNKVTGYDWSGFQNAAMSAGVSPGTISALGKSQAEYQLSLQNLTAKERENQQALNKFGFDSLESVRGEKDPTQRQLKYQQAITQAAKMGADTRNYPQQAPDDNGLDVLEAGLGMHAQALANAKTTTETFEAQQKGQQAQAETQKINAELAGYSGPLADARYRQVLANLAARKSVSDDDLTFAKGYELSKRETTTSADTLGVTSTNTRGPAGLAALRGGRPTGGTAPGAFAAQSALTGGTPQGTPSAAAGLKNSLVDMVGQYKLNPTVLQRMIVKHPDVIAAVQQKYPDWDQTSYNAKNKLLDSYTSGPESKSINAISTALGHAGELGDAIEALHNGNVPILNGIANRLGVAFGETPVTTFNTIVHRLAPEIAAAYIQGGGGEGERGTNAKDFSSSLGDEQLRSNLAITVKLLRSKIAAQEQQWNNTYQPSRPQDQFSTRFLTPLAQRTLSRWAPQSGTGGGNRPPLSSFER